MTLYVVYTQRVHCAVYCTVYKTQIVHEKDGGPGYSRVLDKLGVSDLIGDDD
jgi:hypothetical protein